MANDLNDLNDNNKSSRRNQVGILGVHAAHLALDVFVSTFLTARILSVTNGDLSKVVLFYACIWIGIFATFWIFSYVVKKFSRVWCIRASTFGLLVSLIMVLLFQDNLTDWYLILGALWGIADGIYWCSIHTFTSETMGGKKMAGYAAWYLFISSATKIVFPFTLGAIIEFVDFATAASIVAGLAALLLIFTLILRDQRKSQGNGFSMHAYFKKIRDAKISRPIFTQFLIQTVYGFSSVTTLCVTILVALRFKNDFSLGTLTSIFAGASIILLIIYKAVKSPRAKLWIYYIFGALPLVASLGLLFGASPLTVILCQGAFLSFKVPVQIEFESVRMNLMADFGAEHFHTEGLLFTEFSYLLARLLGLVFVLIVHLTGVIYLLQVLLVFFMASFLVSVVMLHLWTKKYIAKKK